MAHMLIEDLLDTGVVVLFDLSQREIVGCAQHHNAVAIAQGLDAGEHRIGDAAEVLCTQILTGGIPYSGQFSSFH